MSQVIVGRWGKNLAIRVPNEIVDAIGLNDGDRVEFEPKDGELVIRRTVPRVSLKQLFDGRTSEEWRAEYAGTFDWGPELGREIVDA
jgi:antitoxin MazE